MTRLPPLTLHYIVFADLPEADRVNFGEWSKTISSQPVFLRNEYILIPYHLYESWALHEMVLQQQKEQDKKKGPARLTKKAPVTKKSKQHGSVQKAPGNRQHK